MIAVMYDAPDGRGDSEHELREMRQRWFGGQGTEVVVDTDDGRVVTVWRKGYKQ